MPIIVRASFGGMHGDMCMLHWYANRCFLASTTSNTDGDSFHGKFEIIRNDLAKLIPSQWTSVSTLLPLHANIYRASAILASADFHVFPQICRKIAEISVEEIEPERIKMLMWEGRSSINCRKKTRRKLPKGLHDQMDIAARRCIYGLLQRMKV